jgi:hypothetical protein
MKIVIYYNIIKKLFNIIKKSKEELQNTVDNFNNISIIEKYRDISKL